MLDGTDRALVHALHVDGRASFRRIAEVLGVSTQTVTRRYQRLRRDAGLRVVGLARPDHAGEARWLVRLTAAPATAGDLARALARRHDTSWVRLASGGTEIVAVVTVPEGADAPGLLLHDVPRARSVTALSAHALLHTYLGGPTTWPGRARALTPVQQRSLSPVVVHDGSVALDSDDRRLLGVLAVDGRASQAELAAALGTSPGVAARRLGELRRRGAVFLDVEIDDRCFGVGTRALLWLSVAPRHLDATARALAGHEDLAFVAATTGTHNLVAQALAADPGDLHRYLTGPLDEPEADTHAETTPILRTLKTAGTTPAP